MANNEGTKFRQDMPPEGGYAKIYTQRTFPRISSVIGKRTGWALLAITAAGFFKYRAARSAHFRWKVELNDVRMVMTAFLRAERDRIWLNRLRRLRDEERELMKDVPGWRVGTWYGEPIYYTLAEDQWWDPSTTEVFAHASIGTAIWHEQWRIDSDMRGGPKWYDKYLPFFIERT